MGATRGQRIRGSEGARKNRGQTAAVKSDKGQGDSTNLQGQISRIENAEGLSNDQRDAMKYRAAVEMVDQQIGDEAALGSKEYREAIDATYATMNPSEDNKTGADFREEDPLSNLIRSADEGYSELLDFVGSGADWVFDNVVTLPLWAVEAGLNNLGSTIGLSEEPGDTVVTNNLRNLTNEDTFGMLADIGADIALGAIPGVGIPLVAAKNAIQQSDNIYEAATGRDNLTREKLDLGQQGAKALEATLAVATSALPGVGNKMKAGGLADAAGAASKAASSGADDAIKAAYKTGEGAAQKAYDAIMDMADDYVDDFAQAASSGAVQSRVPAMAEQTLAAEAAKEASESATREAIDNVLTNDDALKLLGESGDDMMKAAAEGGARNSLIMQGYGDEAIDAITDDGLAGIVADPSARRAIVNAKVKQNAADELADVAAKARASTSPGAYFSYLGRQAPTLPGRAAKKVGDVASSVGQVIRHPIKSVKSVPGNLLSGAARKSGAASDDMLKALGSQDALTYLGKAMDDAGIEYADDLLGTAAKEIADIAAEEGAAKAVGSATKAGLGTIAKNFGENLGLGMGNLMLSDIAANGGNPVESFNRLFNRGDDDEYLWSYFTPMMVTNLMANALLGGKSARTLSPTGKLGTMTPLLGAESAAMSARLNRNPYAFGDEPGELDEQTVMDLLADFAETYGSESEG